MDFRCTTKCKDCNTTIEFDTENEFFLNFARFIIEGKIDKQCPECALKELNALLNDL